MIKASELRIGNIVECSGEVYTVNGIPNSNTVLLYGWPYKEPPVSIRPVILTEEWLLKLGFSRSALPFSDGVYEGPIIDHRVEYNAGSFMYCLWSQHLRNMEHVHQLQNLYHALTGEELQIKSV